MIGACAIALLVASFAACGDGSPDTWLGDDTWIPDNAVIVFQDDFDGGELDTSVWNTCHWWAVDGGCTISTNAELQWYQPDNVTQQGSVLRLEARPETITSPDGDAFEFTSGMVTTGPPDYTAEPKFAFRYGGAEARVRVPAGAEFWPAFWLLPASTESRPEIDVMEMHGDQLRTNDVHLHSFDAAGERVSWGDSVDTADISEGWHTFGLIWAPDRLSFFVDGKLVSQLSSDNAEGVLLPDEPLYLVLNLAVDSEPHSPPAGPDAFPAALEVDWVQVWQLPEHVQSSLGRP
jgi:beta-glucanase (GH16 family)